MKHHKMTKCFYYFLPGLLVFFAAHTCFSSDTGGVMSKIKNATQRTDSQHLAGAAIQTPKNIVKATMTYQGGTFYTETRKDRIKRFNCRDCHNNKKVHVQNATAISHADIKVVHGAKGEPLSCNTCHSEDDRNVLVTSKENQIDFDHVYNMCGQCHFRQKKDWIGGAHGKRVTFWAGERVVKNCTSCHDPHSPRFKKRWPSTYSVPLN